MTIDHGTALSNLVHTDDHSGTWWWSVARALDDLEDRLLHEATQDDGPDGAFRAAVERAPCLANEATRVAADRGRLIERAKRLRRVVAEVAGDATQVAPVTRELEVLAVAEHRQGEKSRAVFWDSFSRDIGGE